MDAALAADQQLIEIRSRLSDKRAGVSGRSPPGDRPCGRILRRGCQSSPRCSRGHRWSGNCRCSRLGASRRRTSSAGFRRPLGFGDPVRGLSDVVGRQTRNARGLVDGNLVRSKHLIKATPSPRVIRSAKRREGDDVAVRPSALSTFPPGLMITPGESLSGYWICTATSTFRSLTLASLVLG
jgi:hypothetical protein